MLKRFVEEDIDTWYRRKHRKPLVVRGARQVGKSTLIRNFADNHRLTLHEINLERHPGLVRTFEKLDMGEILRELEYISGKGKINTAGSLLFLDEIQAVPAAIKALRYFYEDYPELPLIAAGSMLEFVLSDHSYSMPVGRIEYLYMGPMTFEEFLGAKNENTLLELLASFCFEFPFPESAHQKLLKSQREFLMVGGMPEAVQVHIESDDFNEVMNVHSAIIETYRDDFAKYSQGIDLLRLHRIFDYVPSAAGEKVKYSNIDPNEAEIFYWLREGRKENAEIDFVTQLEGQIVPVEVKSGTTGSLKSLHQFMNEKKLKKAVRFDLKPPSLMDAVHKLTHDPRNPGVSFRLLSLPLYMIEQLPRLFPLTSPVPMKEK